MTQTKKFSQFQGPSPIADTDIVVGLRVDPATGLEDNWQFTGVGGGGGGKVISTIDADTSGLAVGNWVRVSTIGGPLYVPSRATSAAEAEVAGVVLEIVSPTQFKLQQAGRIDSGTPGFSGFAVGTVYFLSDTNAGEQTNSPPTTNGFVNKPVFYADGTDSGWIIDLSRGFIIGSPAPIPANPSGGNDTSTHQVNQPGNTFQVGNWVRVLSDNIYTKAIATNLTNAMSVGVVIQAGDPLFTIQFSGINTGSVTGAVDATGNAIAINAATTYYLSEIVDGAICPTEPLLPFSYSKPCYTSESVVNQTGWVLPQRPLSNPDNDPGASPWEYLGTLDASNNFGNSVQGQTNLMSLEGKLYGAYKIIKTGGANIATVPAGVTNFGFQWYGGGAWRTAAYAHYYSGVNSTANATTTGVLYGRVHNLGTLPMADVTAAVSRINTFGIFEATLQIGRAPFANNSAILNFESLFTDNSITPLPGGFGYTAAGSTFGGGGPGAITGMRLVASNGGVMTTLGNPVYLIYGIPNS